MLAVTRLATFFRQGRSENSVELQKLGGALARDRRRKRLLELLLPQLNEFLNVAVVQVHETHGTGRRERSAEGGCCRRR